MKRKRLACLHGGAHSERLSLRRSVCADYLAAAIYLLDLPKTDLSQFDGLIIPEGLNQRKLDAASAQLVRFLNGSGTVFLFGDQPTEWLPSVRWRFAVAGLPEPNHLRVASPSHPFHKAFKPIDFYHQHGSFLPPEGAEVLMTKRNGDVVLYVDEVSTAGRLMVTSLDLMHHVDGFFSNPISTRFFDRFLPWVVDEFLEDYPTQPAKQIGKRPQGAAAQMLQ
ncbi:MAG: hypothetical protein AAGD43_31910 [Pseudomonadota bacterium]